MTSENPARTLGARPPGWWYPWIIAGGLGIVVVVNAFLFYFAWTTFPGLVMERDDGAEALSVARFAAAKERQDLGWQVAFKYVSTGPRRGRVVTVVSDADGAALAGLEVTAKIVRPTHGGFDDTVALAATVPGSYEADLSLPLAGQWDVTVEARWGLATYWRTWRIAAP